MVVMILDRVPVSLRGELTRWLIEVKPGVYVGHVNAMVRDKLWGYCLEKSRMGTVFQAWTTNNEQRFAMRLWGDQSRRVTDWEGVALIEEVKDKLKPAQKRRVRRD
ncbi:MAG: type I-E CRISPR-associated endoribonuclease Cas2e [Chloroflexi bacterium]|nr:type I-E CRISPR-associated endoribonuclease Cas2e [Chloroflexota bacterium]